MRRRLTCFLAAALLLPLFGRAAQAAAFSADPGGARGESVHEPALLLMVGLGLFTMATAYRRLRR